MSISRAVRNGNASFDRSTRGQRLQQLARARPLHVELGVAGRHVGDERVRVAEVPPHPGLDVAVRGVGGDDPEALVVELGHGEVGLERAALVEPLGVGDRRPASPSTSLAEMRSSTAPGVAALHEELRHERHVHDDHALARGAVLGRPVREPVLAGPTTACSASGSTPARRVPVGALPAADVAEVRAAARPAGRGTATAWRRARSASSGVG